MELKSEKEMKRDFELLLKKAAGKETSSKTAINVFLELDHGRKHDKIDKFFKALRAELIHHNPVAEKWVKANRLYINAAYQAWQQGRHG